MKNVLLKVPTVEGRFLKRINRFVSDVICNGRKTLAHTNNTGRLKDLLVQDREILCMPIRGKRLKWRVVGTSVESSNLYTLIGTSLQEKAVEIAVMRGSVPPLRGWRILARHPKVAHSRFDLMLEKGGRVLPMEIKSAVFYFPEDRSARYPDSPTERGRRHIQLLGELGGFLMFVAAHPLAATFRPCSEDPHIPRLLREFPGTLLAVKMALDAKGYILLLNESLPVRL
ncbi:MAG: DNA/RNA nuclease SfsA [Thermotogae bacterium]|nr:DNA/RNA nuclease SfsA [Thermotogota bacterium]